MVKETRPFNILLIEDNPGDVRLTQEAFKEGKKKVNLEVVMDGVEAIKYFRKEGVYKNKPTPDLVLLDLNLPKWDGREVLKEVKTDPELKRIPIVVLTTSNAEQDIIHSYDLQSERVCAVFDIDAKEQWPGLMSGILNDHGGYECAHPRTSTSRQRD